MLTEVEHRGAAADERGIAAVVEAERLQRRASLEHVGELAPEMLPLLLGHLGERRKRLAAVAKAGEVADAGTAEFPPASVT